jgi:DNA-directed RNA polymerase subunit RPC12/RpoP
MRYEHRWGQTEENERVRRAGRTRRTRSTIPAGWTPPAMALPTTCPECGGRVLMTSDGCPECIGRRLLAARKEGNAA